ncbi:MAG: ferritin-like domain-containing protein [Flavipsychrobacter sp.]|nr:ferritin-like domain-containing protein [Flavipsychrobacter sp.]
MKKENLEQNQVEEVLQMSGVSRRHFLALSGGLAVAGIFATMSSCKKDKDPQVMPDGTIDLGSGDIGILNYAYALEQLEAAFYTRVAESSFSSGFSASEQALLTDIRDHEIAHREFFKAALAGNAIPALEVNFDAIDFGSRTSVLNAARTFEDLGVQAYNGAGQLITTGDYLVLAGKIVSVEARHAAYIRDLITPNSFGSADIIDSNGMDMHKMPSEVLAAAAGFLKSKISGNNLPTS